MARSQQRELIKAVVDVAAQGLGIPGAGLASAGVDLLLERVAPGYFGENNQARIADEVYKSVRQWPTSELDEEVLEWALLTAPELLAAYPIDEATLLRLGLDPDAITNEILARAGRHDDGEAYDAALRRVIREVESRLIANLGGQELTALILQALREFRPVIGQIGDIHVAAVGEPARQESALRSRARQRTAELVAHFRDLAGTRTPYISGPADRAILELLDSDDWFDAVARNVDTVTTALESGGAAGGHRDLMAALRLATERVSYALARQRLTAVDYDRLETELRARRRAERHDPEADQRALTAAAWLLREAANPHHADIAALAGRWGSGKTRTLAETVAAWQARGNIAVLVKTVGAASVQDSLAAALSRAWGELPAAPASGDLAEVLGRAGAPTLLVVDDIEELTRVGPGALDELRDVVDTLGAVPGLRWLLAADSEHLPDLLSRQMEVFWRVHGVSDPGAATFGGWVDLDVANVDGAPGRQILARAVDAPAREAISEELRKDPQQAQVLRDPLPAWLVVEAGLPAGALVDLRQDAVVDAFWVARLGTVRQLYRAPVFDNVVRLVAGLLADSADLTFTADAFHARLGALTAIGAREVAVTVVANLIDLQMLMLTPQQRYQPPSAVLHVWARFIAERVAARMPPNARPKQRLEAVRRWLAGRARANAWLTRAVAHFFLLAPDWQRNTREAVAVWKEWYGMRTLDNAAMYSAAVFAPGPAQAVLARLARTEPKAFTDDTETYLYLRFVLSAAPEAYAPMQRVAALERSYPLVAPAGLGSYLAFAFDRAVADVDMADTDALHTLLDGLHLTPPTGQAPAMCRSVVDYGWQAWDQNPVGWLRTVLDWLSESLTKEGGFPAAPDRETELERPETVPAWVHVVDRVLQKLVEWRERPAWDLLREAGWLSAATAQRLSGPVWRKTRAITHVQIGHSSWQGEDLTALLTDLLAGTGTDEDPAVQRARAYFIVRHTAPIRGSELPPIRPKYFGVISELWADADLRQHLGRRYTDELERLYRDMRDRANRGGTGR